MGGLNALSHAAADTFGVAATVEAPVPSTPPVITNPTNGAKLDGSSMLIVGSCPIVTPQAVVSVSVDGTAAGTSVCDSNNDFSLPVSFGAGRHQITASTLTITGQQGPGSHLITISTPQQASSVTAIALTASQPFIYAAARTVTWSGTIGASGQAAKYYAHIDWGDGRQSNYAVLPGPQNFSHHYNTLTSHNILLTASNKAGNVTSEQFASPVFASYTPAALVTAAKPTLPFDASTTFGLYGLYLSAIAVCGIVWLEAKHAARTPALAQVPAQPHYYS